MLLVGISREEGKDNFSGAFCLIIFEEFYNLGVVIDSSSSS